MKGSRYGGKSAITILLCRDDGRGGVSLAGGRDGLRAEFVIEFFDEVGAVDPEPGFAGSLDVMRAGFGSRSDAGETEVGSTNEVGVLDPFIIQGPGDIAVGLASEDPHLAVQTLGLFVPPLRLGVIRVRPPIVSANSDIPHLTGPQVWR
jgi:hypothetical protein